MDYSDLQAVILNCTLKPTGQASQSELLLRKSRSILEMNGVSVELLRPVDFDIAPGIYADMGDHGYDVDEWPRLSKLVHNADMLIMGTPVWLGEESSVCRRVLERLSAEPGKLNGKSAGCLVSGNGDGKIHCAMRILYTLQEIGCTIPPQASIRSMDTSADGSSSIDEEEDVGQRQNCQRPVTSMICNLLHTARILKDAGGLSNQHNRD